MVTVQYPPLLFVFTVVALCLGLSLGRICESNEVNTTGCLSIVADPKLSDTTENLTTLLAADSTPQSTATIVINTTAGTTEVYGSSCGKEGWVGGHWTADCKCMDAWEGDNCDLIVCLHGGKREYSRETIFENLHSDYPSAAGTVVAQSDMDKGKSKPSDIVCKCSPNTSGDHCEIVDCGKGVWKGNRCECEKNYRGDYCQIPKCQHSGYAKRRETQFSEVSQFSRGAEGKEGLQFCFCRGRWLGEFCHVCTFYRPSNVNQGHCCPEGWYGLDCDKRVKKYDSKKPHNWKLTLGGIFTAIILIIFIYAHISLRKRREEAARNRTTYMEGGRLGYGPTLEAPLPEHSSLLPYHHPSSAHAYPHTPPDPRLIGMNTYSSHLDAKPPGYEEATFHPPPTYEQAVRGDFDP